MACTLIMIKNLKGVLFLCSCTNQSQLSDYHCIVINKICWIFIYEFFYQLIFIIRIYMKSQFMWRSFVSRMGQDWELIFEAILKLLLLQIRFFLRWDCCCPFPQMAFEIVEWTLFLMATLLMYCKFQWIVTFCPVILSG